MKTIQISLILVVSEYSERPPGCLSSGEFFCTVLTSHQLTPRIRVCCCTSTNQKPVCVCPVLFFLCGRGLNSSSSHVVCVDGRMNELLNAAFIESHSVEVIYMYTFFVSNCFMFLYKTTKFLQILTPHILSHLFRNLTKVLTKHLTIKDRDWELSQNHNEFFPDWVSNTGVGSGLISCS